MGNAGISRGTGATPRIDRVGTDCQALSDDILLTIPKNATMAGATHFNLDGLITALRSAVTNFSPDAAKQVDQAFTQANQIIGLDIQKDLLATLGDEWCYYTDPTVAGNGSVGITLVNHLKDAAKAEESLEKLEMNFNHFIVEQVKHEHAPITLAFRHAKLGEATVHYLGMPLLTPAWAIHDGNLYVAFYPEIAAAAANHVANKGEPITENPEFMALYRRLGEHPASSFQFVDLPRLVPNTYPGWLLMSHIANAGDLFGVPAPLMILPPLKGLMEHLSPAGGMSWTDDAGLHFRALSPFPGSELLASDPTSVTSAEVPLMVSILLPALNKAREQAQSVKSATNLKQIGFATIIYSNEHNGKLPDDLGVFVKDEQLTPQVLINPSSGTELPHDLAGEDLAKWAHEHSDYVWAGKGKTLGKLGQDDAIAWENPDSAREDGVYILFADGHVVFTPTQQATAIIQKATEKK